MQHPLGWPGLRVVDDVGGADVVVTLTPAHIMAQTFPPDLVQKRLSVCDMNSGHVWVHEDRWNRTIPDKSKLPLPAYRAYIMQHELGHSLGRHHATPTPTPPTTSTPVPVMVQQTLGIGGYVANPFPTQDETLQTVSK